MILISLLGNIKMINAGTLLRFVDTIPSSFYLIEIDDNFTEITKIHVSRIHRLEQDDIVLCLGKLKMASDVYASDASDVYYIFLGPHGNRFGIYDREFELIFGKEFELVVKNDQKA